MPPAPALAAASAAVPRWAVLFVLYAGVATVVTGLVEAGAAAERAG